MSEALIDQVIAIAREAGDIALSRAGEDFGRWEKVPGQPVCEVDLEVDRLLFQRLMALIPEASWLSEETIDDPVRLERERIWIVDPIDGTRDYIRGRTGWAVSVALVEQGRPVLGILYAPARDELWVAERGKGATLNGVAIHVSEQQTLAGARVPADHLPKVDSDLILVEKPNSIALRLGMVADGRADLVATVRWGNEWDVAAAVLLVEEAGGTVTDAFGRPISFNAPDPKSFGLIASTPAIHAEAVERLAERAAESA